MDPPRPWQKPERKKKKSVDLFPKCFNGYVWAWIKNLAVQAV